MIKALFPFAILFGLAACGNGPESGSTSSSSVVSSSVSSAANSISPSSSPVSSFAVSSAANSIAPSSSPVSSSAVSSAAVSNLVAVRYFNVNGYPVVNMHYNNGKNWTTVPGIPMSAVTQNPGWYTASVITWTDSIVMCFNDGTNWDSAGGANYSTPLTNFWLSNGNYSTNTPLVVTYQYLETTNLPATNISATTLVNTTNGGTVTNIIRTNKTVTSQVIKVTNSMTNGAFFGIIWSVTNTLTNSITTNTKTNAWVIWRPYSTASTNLYNQTSYNPQMVIKSNGLVTIAYAERVSGLTTLTNITVKSAVNGYVYPRTGLPQQLNGDFNIAYSKSRDLIYIGMCSDYGNAYNEFSVAYFSNNTWNYLNTNGLDLMLNGYLYVDNNIPFVVSTVEHGDSKFYTHVSYYSNNTWNHLGQSNLIANPGRSMLLFDADHRLKLIISSNNLAVLWRLDTSFLTPSSVWSQEGFDSSIIFSSSAHRPHAVISGIDGASLTIGYPYSTTIGTNTFDCLALGVKPIISPWTASAYSEINLMANSDPRLASYSNTLYLAYREKTLSDRLTVRKFNGIDWTFLENTNYISMPYVNTDDRIIDIEVYNGNPYVFVQSEGILKVLYFQP